MRSMPLIVLVCLVFCSILSCAGPTDAADHIKVLINRDSAHNAPLPRLKPAAFSPLGKQVSPRFRVPGPITKCKPKQVCASPSYCPTCILPIRRVGQWEATMQVFFARTKGVIRKGVSFGGIRSSEVDFNDDLGFDEHEVFTEYTGRYQFRPRWAIHYSAMVLEEQAGEVLDRTIYFGNEVLGAGTRVRSKWNFLYQRVGLLYQPVLTPWSTLSVFSYWLYTDHRIAVHNEICDGRLRVDRTRHMVMSGVELQRCITTLRNGATLSCDNRVGLGYLDDTFALDVQTGLQFSVPMGSGRYGYARGGYRLLNFEEDRNDLRLDTSFEGGFVEAGLIF